VENIFLAKKQLQAEGKKFYGEGPLIVVRWRPELWAVERGNASREEGLYD
jgi:hypothetical protein